MARIPTGSRDAFPHRRSQVRIACVTWPSKGKGSVSSMEASVAEAAIAVRRLGAARPDLVCLPEGFLYAGIDTDSAAELAVAASSPLLALLSSLASEFGHYLLVPFLERNARAIHNSVLVFDRDGQPLVTYRKRVLWPANTQFTEFEWSAVPGEGRGPIDADFGAFGIQVCMEMHSPLRWRQFKRRGVKLILFPSEQSGGMLLRHRAWQTRAFVVSAVSKGGPSQVIDPVGKVVAEWWPATRAPVIDLGLSFELVHFDHNAQKVKQLAADYKGRIELDMYAQERICRITATDPAVDIGDLLRDRGILALDDYLREVREANAVARGHPDAPVRQSEGSVPMAPVLVRRVSVIIPCLGIPTTLPDCLRALQSQKGDAGIEVILVVNGPDANGIAFEWPGVTIVRETRAGPAAARNAGVRAAHGDVFAFIDADCVADPAWLESAVRTIIASRRRCVVAGGISRSGEEGNWISLFDRRNFLQQERYVTRSQSLATANCFVPRELFEQIGPFDEHFKEAAYEDWEWASRARRHGAGIVYAAAAAVEHPCMATVTQLRAKVERLARGELVLNGMLRGSLRHPGLFARMRSQLSGVATDHTLSLADRLRIMAVGLPVSYWSWRAARRFQPTIMKTGRETDSALSGSK